MNKSPSGKTIKKSPYKLALLRPQTTAPSEPPGESRENMTRKKTQTKKPLTAGQINKQAPSPQATENIPIMSPEPVNSPINNPDQLFTEAEIIEQPLVPLAVENMIPVYPKREEESSEASETEKIKSSPGASQSESENDEDGEDGEDDEDDEAPKKKKNKNQNLLLIRNISDKSEEEEESLDQDDDGNLPLNKNEDSDIERDNDEKSPASADLLIRKQSFQEKNPTIEVDQEKRESVLRKSTTRINPEIELVTAKPPQNPKSRKIHLDPLSPTPATSVGSQITGFLKFGGLSIFGEKRESETPKVNGGGDGDESSDASTPTSVKGRAKNTKRIGTVFKDKSSKSTFGLNYKEESENEKAKKALKENLMSKENRMKINLAVWRRRTGRFIFLALYIVLAIGIGALTFINLIERGKYTNFTHTYLSFTLDNCTIHIEDHEDTSVNSPVYFKYQVPKSSGAQKFDILEPDSSGADYRIIVENKFDISYCKLSLFVKPNTALDSLSFNCGTCNIIQDTSSQLQVTGDVYINGDSEVHANFKDIKVNKFTYYATSGYLQLSNIEAASDSNVIELYGEGDIILQSIKEFQVNITTYTEAFCLGGPFLDDAGGDCTTMDDSADSNTTDALAINETCQAIYNLGTSANSAPTAKFAITAKYDSTVFANVIPGVGSPVTHWDDTYRIRGGAYTSYSFTKTAREAVDNFDSLISDTSKGGNPFVILDLGNFNSRSARLMRWILSSTPSYSLMRPWWIGTLSATVLNGYKEKVTGYIFPGICPYTPQYTISDHYDVYTGIDAYINASNTLLTFVKDNGIDPPPTDPLATSGIYNYSQSRNPFDEWLSFGTLDNVGVALQNNSFSDKPTILASIIASLLIAVLISYLVLMLVMSGVNLMYTKLMNFTSHLQNYARLENRNEDNEQEANLMPGKKKSNQNSLKQFLADSPSPVAFLDYMIMIIYRQYTNSVTQFYQSLFRPINPSQDQELDPNRDMLKGTEAKILYEKFCFLKNISEQKLTDKKNLNILKSFGFEIITRGDTPCEVFTNIKIKNRENFLSSTPKEEKVDSLKIYMDENIEKTEFDEDQVEIEDFVQSYYRFCDHNRFPRVIIYPSLMKERFDTNHASIPQQFLTRIQHEEEDFFGDWIPTKALGLNKLGNTLGLNKLNKLLKPAININAKYYIIDTVRLQNHLSLVMDKVSELSESELSEATLDLILFKGHIVWDAISVLIHLIGTAFVPIPVMAFVVLSDSQYEPWSVKKPDSLVWMSDILRDPATLIQNIYLNFTWNTVIMIITTVLTLLSFIDLLLSYGVMEFPQDKTFRKSHLKSENAVQRLSRQIQWGIVLLILFLYFTYIGLVLTWLLLGAFINPNAFLPFASAAITFVTFFITKYNAFKKLVKEGSEIINKHLKAFMDESVKKVMGKFVEGAEKAAGSVTQKGKGLLESDAFNGATNQLVDIGIMDPSLVEEYKKQMQDLNSQAILEGGIAGIQDKNILINKMDEITNSLKKKGVEKVLEGCRRRKLPEPIIELIIGLLIKDNDQVRKAVFDIIQLFVKEKKMPEETIEIICDLLFPEGGEKNSMARSISSKVMNMISKNLELEAKIPEFNSNTLLLALMDFQNLEEFDYESFLNGLRQLTKNTNHSSAISNLGPALTLISALSQERPKYWKAKEPALELMKSSVNLVTESQEIMDDFSSTTFESFADFISLLSASFGEQSLEPQYMLRIISNFCGATGINKAFYDKTQIGGEFIPSLIYLTLSYTRPETYKLSKEAIQNLAEAFKLRELGNNDFLPFCFELASTIYYDSEQSEGRFLKCIENFDLNPKLGEFAKIVAFYSVDEPHDRHKGVDKNSYFIRIAQKIEMQPQELLGLIDLLYGKHNNQSTRSFLEAIMKRMDIKREKLKKLEPVINLFMSDDESVVLNAVKALTLAQKRFLLIGKGILNPKFVPAKNFEEIGVKNTQIIRSKDTVYDPDNEDEQWLRWKEQLRDDITYTSLGATREGFANKNIDHYIANLVSFYMSDWDRFEYSPKSIANFLTLIDPEKTLVDSDKGSMTSYINFLSVVLPLTTLRLKKKTRCEKLGKDQDAAIKKIADCLNIKLDPLKTCLQMFIVNEQDVISNCFSFFFQDKVTDAGALDRVLAYSFQQVDIMNDKVEFLTKKLPKAISLIDNETATFPGSVIKKLFFGGSRESLRTSDILELSSFIISKLDKSVFEKDQLLDICYKLGLFSKSLLTIEDMVEVFHIKDQGIVNLFRILTESDSDTRIARIIDTFPDDTNPLKFSMALYAVLAGQNPMVKNTTRAGFLRRNKQSAEKEYVTTYLSEMLKVEPELFDLFKIVFERNETRFIQKAMPLLRRITKTSLIDTNLMESLLSLSLGHRFNTSYLSNRLRIPSDTLDFFISLLGLSNKQRRKEELVILSKSTAAKNVLKKLGIELSELVAVIRLVFNMFYDEDNDENQVLLKTITDLGFKTVESSTSADNETVEMERFEGFMTLSLPIDPKLKDKKRIDNLKTLKNQTNGFFSAFSLSPDDAFLISRITIGDFLAIQQYPERLEWAFPLQDQKAASAIMDLTMGICGLVNPHVKIKADFDKQVSAFMREETDQKPSQDSLPNNTLGYATYLTYSTLDIAPFWTQVFMFDKEAYSKLENNVPEIKPDFVITIVTNFIEMSEAARDILAFYEWNKAYRNFMEENGLPYGKFVTYIEEYVWRFFGDRFNFDYNETKTRVNHSKTSLGNLSKKFVRSQKKYTFNINNTLWALLSSKCPSLQSTIEDHLRKPTSEFLVEIAKSYKGRKKFSKQKQEKLAVGEVVKLAIDLCYTYLAINLTGKDTKIQGYQLTDLCLLGTIVGLRNSAGQKIPYERQLYNLHQLAANIERKLFLEDQYYKMSKFKLMKLVGISLGMQVSNIVEWCLPPSLFMNGYVTALEQSKEESQRLNVKLKFCQKLDMQFESNRRDILIGDLGKFAGSGFDYVNLLEGMLKTNGWESINTLLALSEKYLGDPNADAKKSDQHIKKLMNSNILLRKSKVDIYEEALYLPLELLVQKHTINDLQQTALGRNQSRKSDSNDVQLISDERETKKTETLKDAKTSLPYSVLEQRYRDFERTLTHANMGLIQGVINGDPSVMLRGNHDIVRSDPEKKAKAKLYMALIGLQSFQKGERTDRKRLEEYLHPISQKMQSEKSKIRSLLLFFITGNPELKEIISSLELNQDVVDLLFVSLKKNTQNDGNDSEEAPLFDSFKSLLKASDIEIEAFQVIKNIYQFDLNDGWMPLIEILSKVGIADLAHHPLTLLFEMIDFDKLKESSTSHSGQGLMSFMKPKPSEIADTILMISNKVCKKTRVDDETFAKVFQALESIAKQDFPHLFKMLILSNNNKKSGDSPSKSTLGKLFTVKIYEPESLLENLLYLVGVDTRSAQAIKDMKIVRMFLTMANGDFKAIKKSPDYKDIMNGIIDTILESQLFASHSIDKYTQRSLTQLLLGALSWDLEIIMGGLINTSTLEEAYFIYNLFGCLNLSKIYQGQAEGNDSSAQIKKHLEVMLSAVIQNIAPKYETSDLNVIGRLINQDLGSVSSENQCIVLAERMENMLKLVQDLNSRKDDHPSFLQSVDNTLSIPALNSSLAQILSNSEEDAEKDLNTNLVEILTSVCDGTLLTGLINGFIKDEDLKNFLNELIQFIVKLILTLQEKKVEHKEPLFTHFKSLIQAINKLKPHEAWDAIIEVVPKFMQLYVNIQGQPELNQIITEMLRSVKHLLTVSGSEQQALLMDDVFSVVVGNDISTFDFNDTTIELKPKFNTSVGEKTQIIFTKITPKVFPSLGTHITGDQLEGLYRIVVKLQTDFIENIRIPTNLHDVAFDIAQELESFGYCEADFIDYIREVLRGRISYISYLLGKVAPNSPPEAREELRGYLLQCESLFNAMPNNRSLKLGFKPNDTASKKATPKDWGVLLQKIKEGSGPELVKELFQLVDQEGDGSGKISIEEFYALASRLGLKLSQHRITEIFAKVKKIKPSKDGNQELDEKEFEKALSYLEEKNLYQAMEMLGITPENLGVIFVILILLLLLIFIFIFLGIKAFTIGGTFGAVINSSFPAIGGLSLGKKSDSGKEKLEDENVENAAETAYNINASEDL